MAKEELMAVVTTNKDDVGGDVPIFLAHSQEEQERLAASLSQILKAMVHDVGNGIYIIVKH